MKNHISGVFILLIMLTLSVVGQENKEGKNKITKELVERRKNKRIKPLKEDTLITKIATYSNEYKMYKINNEKELIKEYLNGHHIYDNNIEIVNVKVRLSKNINIDEIINSSEELKNILNDGEYNTIGISLFQDNYYNRLKFISTKRYITFNEVIYTISVPGLFQESKKESRKIRFNATSNIPDVYYMINKDSHSESNFKNKSKKIKVELDNNNSFELIVDDDFYKIEFYNSKGEIISSVPNKNLK